MKKNPVIGLNMSMDIIDKYERCGFLVPVSYVDAVAGAGGTPVCIPPWTDMTLCAQILPLVQGFIFIGGDDYRPECYGGHEQPEQELMPERRDRFDLALARWILHKTELPVLGVCGGHQLISIAQGGALIQDIRTEWTPPENERLLPHAGRERHGHGSTDFRHPVFCETGSLIEQVTSIGNTENASTPTIHAYRTGTFSLQDHGALITNSFHHQAVDPRRVGMNLRPFAWTCDGVIEAIEPAKNSPWAQSGRFVLGVQWHPERMQDEEPHRNIFRTLVEASRRKRW